MADYIDRRIDQLPLKNPIAANDLLVVEDALTQQYYRTTTSAIVAGGVDGIVASKADVTYVDAQNAAQNTTIATKADKTYVDAQDTLDEKLANKATDLTTPNNTKYPTTQAVSTALVSKEPTITAGTVSQYYRGDKTFQTLDKTTVGLANVDNTSDANKPVSTATQTALNAKQATLVSGTNIKTINSQSLLGSGDIVISGGGGSGDMTKAVYDTNNDGVVDNSQLLQGQNSAYHLNRTNHTGTQAISTVSGLQTALDATEKTANKGQANGYASLDSNSKVPAAQLPSYVDDVLEYVNLAAFPATGETGKIYVADDTGKIYRWSGSAYIEISPSPGSTDAVPEGSINLYYTNARASAAAPVQSVAGKTGVVTLAKGDVGLGNVDNTSDVNKPISNATQTALNGKEPTVTAGTTGQYYRGDKTFQTLDKTTVGLANVDNTSDANKPISTATQSALNNKQNLVTLTTNNTSGAATFDQASGALNIPNYATGGGGQSVLSQASSQTANFTFTPNTYQPVNASGGSVTGTLPTSTANQWIFVKKTDTTMNSLILSGNINGTSGASIPLRKPNQGKMLYADGSGGWNILVGDIDLTTIDALQQTVIQTSHGFTVGQILRNNGTQYVLSQADSAANADVDGMVVSVPNANTFVLLIRGYFFNLSGLTAGNYFLSPTTAGGYTQTAPTTVGQVNKPVFRAISATTGFFTNDRGIVVSSGGGGSGITRSINSITAATTGAATANTDYVYYWSGSTAFTYTQPTAASNTSSYTLMNKSTINQTVVFTSSQSADGSTTLTLTPNTTLELISNNTNWMIG